MAKGKRGSTTVTEFPVLPQTRTTANHGGWISIPRCLSRLNHRLYREHQNYYASVSLNSAVPTNNPILVYTLAPSWYVQGALRAAKKMHDMAMREERKTIKQARWYDFRLELDIDPAFYDEMLPYGITQAMSGIAAHQADDLVPSLVADATGLQRVFTLRQPTGTATGTGTAFNVFEEYDAMADTPVDNPSTGGGKPYDDLTAELDTENMNNLTYRGDLPPYNGDSFDAYWIQVGELYVDATGAQSLSTGMFQAPLGVVLLTGPGGTGGFADIDGGLNIDRARVNVHVAPGTYKGVHTDAI